MSIFTEAVIAATAGIVVTGTMIAVKTLLAMRRDIVGFSPSMMALAQIQPLLIRATRHQNAALREIGANGSTTRSDSCLDEAEEVLGVLLVAKVGGCTK